MEVCKHFLLGRCNLGDSCRFLHSLPPNSTSPPNALLPTPSPMNQNSLPIQPLQPQLIQPSLMQPLLANPNLNSTLTIPMAFPPTNFNYLPVNVNQPNWIPNGNNLLATQFNVIFSTFL